MVLVEIANRGKAANGADKQQTGKECAGQGGGGGVRFVVLIGFDIDVVVGAKKTLDGGRSSGDLAELLLLLLLGLLEGRAWREEVEAAVAMAVGSEDEGRGRGGGFASMKNGRGEAWQ